MTFESDDEFDEKVIIYSNNDERIHELGQILRTPYSRKIFHLLSDKELHAKEIGKIINQEENPRLPNLIHHLNKMVSVGLLNVTVTKKNGHKLRYYKAIPIIVLVPEKHYEKTINSKTIKNSFKKILKFAAVGIAGLLSYFTLPRETVLENDGVPQAGSISFSESTAIIISLITIIAGLIFIQIYSHYKK